MPNATLNSILSKYGLEEEEKPSLLSTITKKQKQLVDPVKKATLKASQALLSQYIPLLLRKPTLTQKKVDEAIAKTISRPFAGVRSLVAAEEARPTFRETAKASFLKGFRQPETAPEMSEAVLKAYPGMDWRVAGTLGTVADLGVYHIAGLLGKGVIEGVKGLSKEQQLTKLVSQIRNKPQYQEFISKNAQTLSQKMGRPVTLEEVDKIAMRKLWSVKGETPYLKIVNVRSKLEQAGFAGIGKEKIPKNIASSVLQIKDIATNKVSFKVIPNRLFDAFKKLVDDAKIGIAGEEIGGKVYHLTAKTPEKMVALGKKYMGIANIKDLPMKPTKAPEVPVKPEVMPLAKAPEAIKPIESKIPAGRIAQEEANVAASYEKQKDVWIGNKDVRVLQSNIEKGQLQKELLSGLQKPKYDAVAKDYDKAIQLYIDTKRNPEHLIDFYKKLSPEQKKIADLSQNLSPSMKAIADKVETSYKAIGLEAQEAEVIKNVLDNYVNRVWDLSEQQKTELFRKFGTTTRHAKGRVLETILQGWSKGYKLKVEGATNNLQILKEEMVKTIEDKRFLKALRKIKTIDGEPLLTTKQVEGYARIEHPNFKMWKWAGQAEEGEVYGKNVFIDSEGNIFERQELYAPEAQAKNLNNVLGISKLKGVGWIDAITKANATTKAWILQSSFFHHLAFMRSYWLGTNHKRWSEMSPRQAYRQGLRAIEEENPIILLGVKNGLTLGLKQDWNEELLREEGIISKILDKTKATKAVKNKVMQLRQAQADFLFGKFGAGLKAKSFLIEYRNMSKKHPSKSPDEIAKMVANLINDDFGGLHLQRLGRNPTVQHIFRLFALAPDWCVPSDTRAMTKTGWKYHYELEIDKDEILAFNPDTRKYEWSKLNDKYENKDFNSYVISINDHSRKIVMTPEHKCYVYNNSKKKHEVVLAKDINTAHSIPTCADFDFPDEKVFDDSFIHLVGWVVTDGYFKRSTPKDKEYLYAKITQSKPVMVEHLKSLGLKYSIDNSMKEHDGIVSNYPKYTFNIPLDLNSTMLRENLDKGLSWEFLSKLTKEQLEILYDAMMLGDGTGQNRFCGKEKEIFFMTLIQTMLGKPSTFYKQEINCFRTRIVMRKNIGCQNKKVENYKGTIWCPSVDTGFWLAEREGLVFITGNTESNIRTMVKAINAGGKEETEFYRRFWAGIFTKGAIVTVLGNALLAGLDEDDRETAGVSQRMIRNYKRAWAEGKMRWMDVDITALYKLLGGKTDNRKYFSVFGHFKDPIKFVTHPIRSAHHKGSVIYKFFHEALAGVNWAGRRFTTAPEILGYDKEKYKGKTVTWDVGRKGPLSYEQMPSFMLSQIKGWQPIQIQNLLGWIAGEMEGFDALLKSAGLRVSTTYSDRKKEGRPSAAKMKSEILKKYGIKSPAQTKKDILKKYGL